MSLGSGELLVQESAEDATLDLLPRPAVDQRIATGAGHLLRQGPEAAGVGFEDALLDQPLDGLVTDLIAPPGQPLHPVLGRMNRVFAGEILKRGIQQAVPRGGRIDYGERLQVRVDPVLHGEIHEHGPGEGAGHPPLGNGHEVPRVLAVQKQQQLLGESHRWSRSNRSLPCARDLRSPATSACAPTRVPDRTAGCTAGTFPRDRRPG